MTPEPGAALLLEAWSTSVAPSQSTDRTRVPASFPFVLPLSSSSSRAEHDWLAMFPQSSTLRCDAADLPTASPRIPQVLPDTARQLVTLQARWGLTKTQLAQICRVQRQTIYDWLAGNFEAEGNNARRLADLFAFTCDLQATGAQPLSARDLTRMLSDGTTILSVLSTDRLDLRHVRAILDRFQEDGHAIRSRSAAAARERYGWQPLSESEAERNLEANLDDFVDG